MTILIHVVGPQGSGKSTLIQAIVTAAPHSMACVDWEAATLLTNDDIRAEGCALDVVFVEALELGARHRDLRPRDAVLTMYGAPPEPGVQQQEVRDAG